MTQRIFDIENKKDYADIWDILPDWADTITKGKKKEYDVIWNTELHAWYRCLLKINWHDKTEITRPIKEATEADIGKLCKFWNENTEEYRIAILTSVLDKFKYKYSFCDDRDNYWMHGRRLTKQEIEELI